MGNCGSESNTAAGGQCSESGGMVLSANRICSRRYPETHGVKITGRSESAGFADERSMCAPYPCALLWIRPGCQMSQWVREQTMQFDVVVHRCHELSNGRFTTRVALAGCGRSGLRGSDRRTEHECRQQGDD